MSYKYKYRVGEQVRIRFDIDKKSYWIPEMNEWKGKIMTIALKAEAGYFMVEDNGRWYWPESMVSSSSSEHTIIIETDGVKTTTAQLFDLSTQKIIKTAEATCSPNDKFDEETGVNLAIARLYSKRYFRLEKYIEWCLKEHLRISEIAENLRNWAYECDGQEVTNEQINADEINLKWCDY